MNRFVRRAAALAAASVTVIAVTAVPAAATDLVNARGRVAPVAGPGTFPGWSLVSGGGFVYSGEGVEVKQLPGGSYSDFTASCTVVLPNYWMYPGTSRLWAECWIEDMTSGREHYLYSELAANDLNFAWDNAEGLFTLPTSHEYRLCVAARTDLLGKSYTYCGSFL